MFNLSKIRSSIKPNDDLHAKDAFSRRYYIITPPNSFIPLLPLLSEADSYNNATT